MTTTTRGFSGRRRQRTDGRLPPGQHDVGDAFPVLSAGPTPRTDLATWDLTVQGQVDRVARWTWEEFAALPHEDITVDLHCVTAWSKFDTRWRGVSLDTLLEGITPAGRSSRRSATAATRRTSRWPT
jgi:DMSO/TMAO reductase YedYZ molybdopterin-dependent catalytic subunit